MELTIMELLTQTEKKRDETRRLLVQLEEQAAHLRAAAAVTGEVTLQGSQGSIGAGDSGISARYRGTLYMAEMVLKANGGREMHAKEIADRINQQFGVKVRHQSVGSQIWRASKKAKSPFFRSKEHSNSYGIRTGAAEAAIQRAHG